ncbi:hypothetical protein BGZ58_001632 [Dissophora ornata]|nr:hypothetical protein BGZ58_001632 [Dissophora ornata]
MTVEQAKAFVQEHKYNPQYEIVWWMVAGLLDGEASEEFFALSSLRSIDIRFANRLVGPGTTSSRLKTGDQLCVGSVNVSLALMSARKSNVARQSELESVSDLLTLNFIFDEAFLAAHLTPMALAAIQTIDVPYPDDIEPQYSLLAMIQGILAEMVSTAILFMPSSVLKTNEDTYIQHAIRAIIVGIFGDMEIIHHWTRDPLPTPKGFEKIYQPDFFAERDGFPFIVVEVKKPDADPTILDGDARKVPHMMKIALDRMYLAGIEQPVVIGLLVQDRRCQVMALSLPYEAIYLTQTIGTFEIPDDRVQLGLLLPAIGPLACAKDLATNTLDEIVRRPKVAPKELHPWTRPSYYLKCIKVPAPLPPAVDIDL